MVSLEYHFEASIAFTLKDNTDFDHFIVIKRLYYDDLLKVSYQRENLQILSAKVGLNFILTNWHIDRD